MGNRSYARNRRLRIFDLSTRWFWLVIFWRGPDQGIHLHRGVKWTRGWLHVWQWENEPDRRPAVVTEHKGK